nr:MAG TPA: hypothetical protein [Caudoviricetes sp.]
MEGPRTVQQCDGSAMNCYGMAKRRLAESGAVRKCLAKAMHRGARQSNGMAQNGTESQRKGTAPQRRAAAKHCEAPMSNGNEKQLNTKRSQGREMQRKA